MERVNRPYPDLKTWRLARRLSQHQAAEYLELSQSRYSRLERGVQVCHGEESKRLMERTGVPLEVLVGAA